MGKRTALYSVHEQLGAKLVDFAGWDMPIHYGSQIEEHHHVRQHVGLFDVSHMGIVDVTGPQAKAYLQFMLANDVAKLKENGKALYSCLLNEQGGVIDDLIAYRLDEEHYRLVINASRVDEDTQWLKQHASQFDVTLTSQTDLSIVAVQGPNALDLLQQHLPNLSDAISALKPFHLLQHNEWIIARTGYTGENGVEIMLPHADAVTLWQALMALGAKPAGLGARDTLRLEAGYNLYGADMTENTHPLESNLSWTISWQDEMRDFIGKKALQTIKAAGVTHKLVGLIMETPGVLRDHQVVKINGVGEGEITSGSFSPTLGHAIALARVPMAARDEAIVERRGKEIPVRLIKPAFVRQGKKIFDEAAC